MAADAPEMPLLTLRNGVKMPQIAFQGKWRESEADDQDETLSNLRCKDSFVAAIGKGYRHLEAFGEDAERALGEAISEAVNSTGIPREQFFITCTLNARSNIPKELERSLARMKLEYVDLCLVDILRSCSELRAGERLEAWKAMENIYSSFPRRAWAIGIIRDTPNDRAESILHQNDLKIRPHVCRTMFVPSRQISEEEATDGMYKGVRIQNPVHGEMYPRLGPQPSYLRQRLLEENENERSEDNVERANRKLLKWQLEQKVAIIANEERMDIVLGALNTEVDEDLLNLITSAGLDMEVWK